MHQLQQEFETIDSEAALRAFLQRNGFRMADARSHADQYVLGAFFGRIDGQEATVMHRLFDADADQASNGERNQVVLEVGSGLRIEVRFRGTY